MYIGDTHSIYIVSRIREFFYSCFGSSNDEFLMKTCNCKIPMQKIKMKGAKLLWAYRYVNGAPIQFRQKYHNRRITCPFNPFEMNIKIELNRWLHNYYINTYPEEGKKRIEIEDYDPLSLIFN